MTYKPRRNVSNGRRKDAVSMVKFLTQYTDRVSPQEKGRIADTISAHYTELTRGEINRMITRVLRANGKMEW